MTTYLTSDFHIGHGFVSGLRGFKSVEEHDKAIQDAFNVVFPDDIVWILGDICVSASGWMRALELLKKQPGRKRLIAGNHDPVANHHREAWKFYRQGMEVFESIQEYGRIKIGGGYALMSHYPYSGTGSDHEGEEERYSQYRLPDLGMTLFHGHTHGKERVHYSDRGTLEVHVGMDAWGMQLVPFHDLEKLLREKDREKDDVSRLQHDGERSEDWVGLHPEAPRVDSGETVQV